MQFVERVVEAAHVDLHYRHPHSPVCTEVVLQHTEPPQHAGSCLIIVRLPLLLLLRLLLLHLALPLLLRLLLQLAKPTVVPNGGPAALHCLPLLHHKLVVMRLHAEHDGHKHRACCSSMSRLCLLRLLLRRQLLLLLLSWLGVESQQGSTRSGI